MDVQDIVRESTTGLCRASSNSSTTGRKEPSNEALRCFVEICQALGVSPASILKFPGEPVMTVALPAIRKKDRQLQPVELAAKDAMTREGVLEREDFERRIEAIDDLPLTGKSAAGNRTTRRAQRRRLIARVRTVIANNRTHYFQRIRHSNH